MIYTLLKKCYLAFIAFMFIHGSHYAFTTHLNINDTKGEALSISTIHVSDETVFENMNDCTETAFAFLNDDDDPLTADDESICFIPQFNRWGWTTFLNFSEETSYVLDFYAGAGQCDLSKGSDVGSVTVTYNEDNTITFDYDLEGYLLSEAHIYIGVDMYPTNNAGVETVAPGQYTFTDSDLGQVQSYSVTIPVEGSEFYIIVHGVTEEEGCSDSSDGDNGDDSGDDGDGDDGDDGDNDGGGDGDDGDDGDNDGGGDDDDCPDSDGDGVCDEDDICPGHDDNLDSDGDGTPDGCDQVAYEAHSFDVYLVSDKDNINVRYSFDYETNIVIEVFDMKGVKLREYENKNYIPGSEGNTTFGLSQVDNQLVFVRLTTSRGQFTKKTISSNLRR